VDRSEHERGMPGFESLMDGMRRLAVTAAGQTALAMVSLRLREELESQSVRDPLTGLYNRRVLEASLHREILRARRKGHSVSVVFIDLDHFKKFNDTFGHAAGDEVLMTMGKMFQEYFRGEDVVCRYGGEEFAIVMPEARAGDAAARAEGLRAKAENLSLQFHGQKLDRVTLSIGIAAYPQHGTTRDSLLRAADECLYRSKSAGRNRITVAESQTQSPAGPLPAEKLLT
jgi:diguanylate cyclase (GGDEF)-like protein